MNTKIKFAAALTALTVATTLAMPSSEAQARRWGLGLGLGLATGVVVGSAIANSYAQPVYVGGVRRCFWQRQFDGLGNYMGSVKVCKIYY
jgi:hypothetical protein